MNRPMDYCQQDPQDVSIVSPTRDNKDSLSSASPDGISKSAITQVVTAGCRLPANTQNIRKYTTECIAKQLTMIDEIRRRDFQTNMRQCFGDIHDLQVTRLVDVLVTP